MANRITINVRVRIIAPYDNKIDSFKASELIKSYFASRGNIESIDADTGKIVISSYKFRKTEAEIKIKIFFNRNGNLDSIDTLGTFDSYKKNIIENINMYRVFMKGFIKWLEFNVKNWYIDAFNFRVYPVSFMRHFGSRIGDEVSEIYLNIIMKDGSYCIIKGDRLEYITNDWTTADINTIMTIINKYTRK